MSMNTNKGWTRAAGLAAALALLLSALAARAADQAPAQRLRIVGGLAGVSQYTRQEEPFWTRELPRLTNGRVSAEIVPFDRAGIRGQEMLRLMQLGVVPYGTALLSLSATQDPVFGAPDLAGLNPDMASTRKTVAAFRPIIADIANMTSPATPAAYVPSAACRSVLRLLHTPLPHHPRPILPHREHLLLDSVDAPNHA